MTVFDLKTDKPSDKSRSVWIDTNVLLWCYYYSTVTVCAKPPKNYQLSQYSNAIGFLVSENYKIFTTIYNISEVILVIEKIEYENYLMKNNLKSEKYSKKQFKKDYINDLHNIIENVLLQIESLISIDESGLNFNDFKNYLSIYSKTVMGFFDYILSIRANYTNANNICGCVITDDKDFLYKNHNLDVYTANNGFIQEAKTLGVMKTTK